MTNYRTVVCSDGKSLDIYKGESLTGAVHMMDVASAILKLVRCDGMVDVRKLSDRSKAARDSLVVRELYKGGELVGLARGKIKEEGE